MGGYFSTPANKTWESMDGPAPGAEPKRADGVGLPADIDATAQDVREIFSSFGNPDNIEQGKLAAAVRVIVGLTHRAVVKAQDTVDAEEEKKKADAAAAAEEKKKADEKVEEKKEDEKAEEKKAEEKKAEEKKAEEKKAEPAAEEKKKEEPKKEEPKKEESHPLLAVAAAKLKASHEQTDHAVAILLAVNAASAVAAVHAKVAKCPAAAKGAVNALVDTMLAVCAAAQMIELRRETDNKFPKGTGSSSYVNAVSKAVLAMAEICTVGAKSDIVTRNQQDLTRELQRLNIAPLRNWYA